MKGILVGLLALAAPISAYALEPEQAPGDWAAYSRDPGGARFSPLAQITPKNVSNLQVAWTYHMNVRQQERRPYATTTPIVIGDRMYLGTPYGRVVALQGTSGRELWAYTLPEGDQPALRGIGYWPGDQVHAARILIPTMRGRLIAVEAATGKPSPGFGADGIIDAKTPEVMNGFPDAYYAFTAPPVIYKNLAILGSRVQETPTLGASGDVRAFDVITGKQVWSFRSVPGPGEPFHETWEGDSWKQRSGVNMWHLPTVDAERGIAYLTFGAPGFDRYGGDRKGSNLFANSIVAVDANTGKYLWHFQTVHHDIWDYDLPAPPTLITVVRSGRKIPAVAAMNKTALLFLLDRVTGKPIFGVTETAVPPSSIPSESAAPTQPFPKRPGILTRMSFELDELAQVTPDHTAACRALVEREALVGSKMFEPLRTDRTMIRFPAAAGGVNWGGGAYDPRRGYYVFAANQLGQWEKLTQGQDGEWSVVGQRFVDPATRSPCQAPPWGELVAVNVSTGRVAWRSVLGVTDAFPEGKQKTGRPANAGPIMTASGLIFIGATDDQRFRAFDSRTGKELWTHRLEYSAHATPITYEGSDARQYVAVVATGGSYLQSPTGGDALVAFALPK